MNNADTLTRDIILSVLMHAVVITTLLVAGSFSFSRTSPIQNVIRVSLTAPSEMPMTAAPEPLPAPTIPRAAAEEEIELPVERPVARDEKVPIESEAAPEEQQPPAEKPPEPKPAVVQQDTEQEPAGAQEQTADGTGTELDESATGGEGSPFAGATIDNASFNYPYWFTQAFRKIRSNWRNPVSHQGTLVCVIYFQVIQSGRVINLQIRESSGIDAFDDACLRSVERSAPFPPLPREFREEIIGINLPFKYQPR
jgi:periplasmic protein TonB